MIPEKDIKIEAVSERTIIINGKYHSLPKNKYLSLRDRIMIALANHLEYEPANLLQFYTDWDEIDRETLRNEGGDMDEKNEDSDGSN